MRISTSKWLRASAETKQWVLDNPDKIDAPIAKLVAVLNTHSAFATIESCGGHDNPHGSQRGPNAFYIVFHIIPNQAGWLGLTQITQAIKAYTYDAMCEESLRFYTSAEFGSLGVDFWLEGEDIDLDELADYIKPWLENFEATSIEYAEGFYADD